MRPIIVTPYNSQVDIAVVYHQQQVIHKLRQGIPFLPYDYTGQAWSHPDVCNKLVHKVFYEYQESADCVLFLDVDCVPMSKQALEYTFHAAYSGKLVGNAQRSNHYENDSHVYAAPSYMCFTRDTYEQAGHPTMNYSKKYDCGEILTVNCEKVGIPVQLFMPRSSDALNPDGALWDLAEHMPKYGVGTTFSHGGQDMSYHLFCASLRMHGDLFVKTCVKILTS